MPSATRSYIANIALRMFLERVGHTYDRMRGLTPCRGNAAKAALLSDFGGLCVYCETPLIQGNRDLDHLVPINRAAVGLHSWGNLAWACKKCNRDKGERDWRDYLGLISRSHEELVRRITRIERFQQKYGYAPGVELRVMAEGLYEEVGAQTMVLIDLKVKTAEALVARLGQERPDQVNDRGIPGS